MPKPLPASTAALVLSLIGQGATYAQAAREAGVSRGYVYKLRKRVAIDGRTGRKLKPCGTNAAYKRHRQKGERCVKCWKAHADAVRKFKKKKPGPKGLRPCGTEAAYRRHYRNKETPDQMCLDAHKLYKQEKKRKKDEQRKMLLLSKSGKSSRPRNVEAGNRLGRRAS